MKKLATLLIPILILVLVLASGCVQPSGEPKEIHNTAVSGRYNGDQIWSGEILVTGDVGIGGTLTILPGTIIKFKVSDDTNHGEEVPADGYNDLDPTRLREYDQTHSSIYAGKIIASGTPDNKIVFTSAAEEPNYADWVSIGGGDGSLFEYAIVEWSRNGITLDRDSPNTIVRYNVINYTYWGSISSGFSGAKMYSNEIWESGHECIDVQGGNPLIENNKLYNCHVGVVILDGSATVRNNTMINVGKGIHVEAGATPILENNHIEISTTPEKQWIYGNFAYNMFGEASLIE